MMPTSKCLPTWVGVKKSLMLDQKGKSFGLLTHKHLNCIALLLCLNLVVTFMIYANFEIQYRFNDILLCMFTNAVLNYQSLLDDRSFISGGPASRPCQSMRVRYWQHYHDRSRCIWTIISRNNDELTRNYTNLVDERVQRFSEISASTVQHIGWGSFTVVKEGWMDSRRIWGNRDNQEKI